MDYLIPPWQHQFDAISKASQTSEFALFFEMGCGKTGTLINILRHKFNAEKKILRTLILCPPIVVANWKDEWKKHSRIDPGQIILLTGSGKQRLKAFQANSRPGGIFVTNYESLLMADLFEALREWQPQALVLDESHKCKERTARRTKLAQTLAETAQYKYLLSGSPVLNSPMDLFSQFNILDGGASFGKNFFAFRAKYFRDKNAGMPRDRYFPKWEIRPGALEEINSIIMQKSMRVEKKDCLDLPLLVRQVIKVGMTPEQTRMYLEMKQDFVTYMGDKEVVATMAMTKALRLMQIASGFAGTTTGDTARIENTPKMDALRELLAELTPNHKVIVWAVWKENYSQIREVCDALGLKYVELTGDTPAAQRFARIDQFNTDPECRVFFGHPGSAGIGVNLTVATYSIFYSRTFSLEHSLQAESRNHRGGSEIHDKITRIDLVCGGTIDELVGERLAQKQEMGAALLGDLAVQLELQE